MSVTIGTPLSGNARRVLLLGSGELGKEVAIELQRYGVEVIAADRYANAPAMQVAHRGVVLDMLDARAIRALIDEVQPHLIVPEIEAISTATLVELEAEWAASSDALDRRVVPTARATALTMDREGIRRLAAETLGLPTSPFEFVDTEDEFLAAVARIGMPCVVKPVMSSSGKGQSTIRHPDDVSAAWAYAQRGGRTGEGRVIVEGFVDFEYEITLLTVRHRDGVDFCEPIGHVQKDGDYRESWQPQPMNPLALERSREIAREVTANLGGWGVFGVELFVRGDDVWFSEVSPRPHDTGLVTLIGQDLSEFALHARAILGLPIPQIRSNGASASCAVIAVGEGVPEFSGVDAALAEAGVELRLFGKPVVEGQRRVGVTLALGESVEDARKKARNAAQLLQVKLIGNQITS